MADFGITEGIMLAGVIVAAAGTAAAAQAQSNAAKYNAKVADNNAVAARQQAAFDAEQTQLRLEKIRGSQAAAYAKSGISGGSSLDVGMDTATQGELDALSATYKGNVNANRYQAQAGLDRYEAQAAQEGGYLSAASTLMGGASSAYGSYSARQGTGMNYGAASASNAYGSHPDNNPGFDY